MRNRQWFLLLLALWVQSALAEAPIARPFKAVTYQHEVRSNPPLHLHVVTIDLNDPAIKVRVVAGDTGPDKTWPALLTQTSLVAEREGFDIAVNGDFFAVRDKREVFGKAVPYFAGNPARPQGLAMTDGRLWNDCATGKWCALVVRRNGSVEVGPLAKTPDDAMQIVGGSTMLVVDGKVSCPATETAPRTAAGIDREGRILTLVVVDGRRPEYSAGLTFRDLATEMIRLRCWRAINLDGGGSTTLVMRNRETGKQEILNRPSDGHDLALPLSVERPVCNVLGIAVADPDARRRP